MHESTSQLQSQKGAALVTLLVFVAIGLYVTTAFISWAATSIQAGRHLEHREQAIHLAEAGQEYYRWFLAHSDPDLQSDPPTPSSPLLVFDAEGNEVGQANFSVTTPFNGSAMIDVDTQGVVTNTSQGTHRSIRTRLALPSLTRYSLASNADLRVGENTEVFGQLHANGGVRFDGYAHNLVSSAKESYDDLDHSGDFEFGVHTHVSPVDPTPPSTVPERPDVFGAGRSFPVTQVDYAGITSDLAILKSSAQEEGLYLPPSGRRGYLLELRTDGTFDVSEVRSVKNLSWICEYFSGGSTSWSVRNITNTQTYSYPDNGVIFVEDNVWIEGQIDGQRLTIASGVFPDSPSTRTSITVNNDLLYTSKDGTDVIALIAQDDINVGFFSEDDLEINAALVAQNGRVGRYYYSVICPAFTYRDTITVYGMIATNQRYGFAYTNGTGYEIRNIIYDANLLYGPPPGFPLTSEEHEILSWEELE